VVVPGIRDAHGRPRAGAADTGDRGPKRGEAERALRTGRYEEARRIAGVAASKSPGDAAATIVAARAELALGLYAEARQRLAAAVDASPDNLPLRAALMRLHEATGDRAGLAPLVDRTYDDWKNGRVDKTKPGDLIAVATAVRLDNNWKDASDALRDAVRADPRAGEANLEWGRIFLEKHASAEAEACFLDVLKLDPDQPDARVGLARVLLEQRYDVTGANQELDRALAVNPRHAGALALRAELALDGEDFAFAAARVAEIRRTSSRDEGAARIAAAAALLLDDRAAYQRERDQRLADHPGDGDFFAFVAELLNHQRRYDDARAVAEEGVSRDGKNARCLAALGTMLLRLGEEESGLAALRRAWKRDPYDVRTYNLLNLFEKVIPARYTVVASKHLRFRIPASARAAIEAVVSPFLEETYRRYVARYGFEPKGPIVFELYDDPAHFGVRTVGLPGIGVSGVCFGRVITSQAPTNRAFNWGLVLSHELAHVFAIELSRSRMPRWFAEGLAELETLRARPEWRRHDDVAIWGALKAGRLPTLVDLSAPFTRATEPDGATRAYAHAAVALDFLERRFGFAKIRTALQAYGRGERGAAVLEALSGLPAAKLEQMFREEIANRGARYQTQFLPTQTLKVSQAEAARRVSESPRSPTAHVQVALAALAGGDARAATAELAQARTLPGDVEDDQAAVLFLTAELALGRRDAGAAVTALEALLNLGPPAHDGYDVRVRLALAEIHRSNLVVAEGHLRKAIAFDPERVEPHALLVELLADLHRPADRLDEMETTFRLEPQNAKLSKELVLGNARAGRPGRVVELAPMAILVDPADADIHAAHGRALQVTGRAAAAAAAFELALLFHPTDPAEIHRALAALYTKLGDHQRAASHASAAKRN
jgi:tetratricopeptide (TPR) repeat protein